MKSIASAYRQSAILPPRGLLLALMAQLPLLLAAWPAQPEPIMLLIGLLLVAGGAALNVWSASLFKRNAIDICPLGATPKLVAAGPFALSRNPMYLGLIAILLGSTIATGVLANAWISVAFAIWLHHAWVVPEERFLRELFPGAYQAYERRVSRWIGMRR